MNESFIDSEATGKAYVAEFHSLEISVDTRTPGTEDDRALQSNELKHLKEMQTKIYEYHEMMDKVYLEKALQEIKYSR